MDSSLIQESAIYMLLQEHPGWIALIIAVIAFIESFAIVGLIMPGVAMLYVAAFAAGSGLLDVWSSLAAAIVGAVLGDGSSFLLGHYYKQDIVRFGLFRRHQDWLERGTGFISEHGVKSVVIGRFLGPVRPVVPLAAGILGMRPRKFFMINVLSSLGWAPVYIMPGFLLGAAVDTKLASPGYLSALALGLVLLAAGFHLFKHHYIDGKKTR
jgi:undecaprenyl-diphosphatase